MKAVEKRFRILGRAQNCRCFCWIFGWVSQLHHAKDVQKFSRLLWCHGNWEIYFCGYLLILSSYSPLGIAPFSSRVLPDGIKVGGKKSACIAPLVIVKWLCLEQNSMLPLLSTYFCLIIISASTIPLCCLKCLDKQTELKVPHTTGRCWFGDPWI